MQTDNHACHGLNLSVIAVALSASIPHGLPAKHKPVAPAGNKRYHKDLSKTISDLPSRNLLAFFVPDVCPAAQAGKYDSTIQINPQAYFKHGGNTVYDGLTLPNKRALGRISKAVTNSTESKTRHLLSVFNTVISVAITQKLLGDSHHG